MTISDKINSVLLITSSHVGNNIICTPAIRLLKRHFPDIELDVVSMSARGVDAFKGNPDIRKVYFAFTKGWIRRLTMKYDYVIGFHKSLAVTCMGNLKKPFATLEWKDSMHRADAGLEFMSTLIDRPVLDEDRRYILMTEPHHTTRINSYINDCDNGHLVGMHLGCGRTAVHGWKFWYPKRAEDKRLWLLGNYISLAQSLKKADPRIRIVITGQKGESFLAKEFLAAVPDAINLIGRTNLQEAKALMQKLKVFVTPDTGMMHVASVTDVPIIGLFGPSSPEITGPYPLRSQHTIIKKPSMLNISVWEVTDAVLEKLS